MSKLHYMIKDDLKSGTHIEAGSMGSDMAVLMGLEAWWKG